MKNLDIEQALEVKFGDVDIEKELEEAEKEISNPKTRYYTHEEMEQMARRIIDGK